jgi:hypothetical protein
MKSVSDAMSVPDAVEMIGQRGKPGNLVLFAVVLRKRRKEDGLWFR